MAPTAHSSFSASSAHRLLSCPGSYELGQRLDDGTRKSSVYSAEGTLAHAVSEICIHTGKYPADFIGQTLHADGFSFEVSEDFAEAAQTYVDFVQGLVAMGYVVALENRVSPTVQFDGLPALPVELFGTADCVAYNPGTKRLVIGDLKFGAGVAVEALGNPQLHYYAAGAMSDEVLKALCADHGVTFNGVSDVSIVVIQPRAFHRDGPIRAHLTTPREIRHWARTELYPGIQKALSDKGQTLLAGKHCRFCPVLPHCKKPHEMSLSVATSAFLDTPVENIPAPVKGDLTPVGHLSDEELALILDKMEVIKPWLNAIQELALARAEEGRTIGTWKAVPKRALRRFADPDMDTNVRALELAGLLQDDYLTTKLLTPAQIEKNVGKQAYDTLVAPLIVKSSSGNTLASDGDPRARIAQRPTAAEAFGFNPPTSK